MASADRVRYQAREKLKEVLMKGWEGNGAWPAKVRPSEAPYNACCGLLQRRGMGLVGVIPHVSCRMQYKTVAQCACAYVMPRLRG
jgi:hypothetical protein